MQLCDHEASAVSNMDRQERSRGTEEILWMAYLWPISLHHQDNYRYIYYPS